LAAGRETVGAEEGGVGDQAVVRIAREPEQGVRADDDAEAAPIEGAEVTDEA
jgi:hypothetical protein